MVTTKQFFIYCDNRRWIRGLNKFDISEFCRLMKTSIYWGFRIMLALYTCKNLTTCYKYVFATGLQQACQQIATMLLFYQVATRLSLTTCWQIVELQDNTVSLLSSTTLQQVVNKPLTTCQQAGNKQCEHILLTSCWNSIATSLLQVCYNLCVFTCVF